MRSEGMVSRSSSVGGAVGTGASRGRGGGGGGVERDDDDAVGGALRWESGAVRGR